MQKPSIYLAQIQIWRTNTRRIKKNIIFHIYIIYIYATEPLQLGFLQPNAGSTFPVTKAPFSYGLKARGKGMKRAGLLQIPSTLPGTV